MKKLAPSPPLIPLDSGASHLFTVNGDIVQHNSTVDKSTILFFSTAIVDADNFEFSVTNIAMKKYYHVGIIAEGSVEGQIWNISKSISFYNLGQVWMGRNIIKDNLFTAIPFQDSACFVVFTVNRRNNTLVIRAGNGQAETVTEIYDLSIFGNKEGIIPFVLMTGMNDSVRVNLK